MELKFCEQCRTFGVVFHRLFIALGESIESAIH